MCIIDRNQTVQVVRPAVFMGGASFRRKSGFNESVDAVLELSLIHISEPTRPY